MTTNALLHSSLSRTRPTALLRALVDREPRLAIAGITILMMMVPTAVALLVDDRTLNDISVWVKPLKFQASVGIYLLTLAWFIGALPRTIRRGRLVGAIIATAVAASAFEIGYITLQAARGLASHYNRGDPFHSTMYTLMGIGAVVLAAASPAVGALLLRHRPREWQGAFWLSVVIGLALTFVLGAGAGVVLSAGDSHWIGGVRSDAGGVPIVGWSRTGGDLRVAHFLGMHALHILPVLGFLAANLMSARAAKGAVLAGSLAYVAITAFVFRQALAGIPLVPV